MKLKKVKGDCEVQLTFHCSRNFKMFDIDNGVKPALDSLTEAGLIEDDRFVLKLSVDKIKDKKDFWEFSITKK